MGEQGDREERIRTGDEDDSGGREELSGAFGEALTVYV